MTTIYKILNKTGRVLILAAMIGALMLPAYTAEAKKKATTSVTAQQKSKTGAKKRTSKTKSKSAPKSKNTAKSKNIAKSKQKPTANSKATKGTSKDVKRRQEETRREITQTKEQIKANDAAVKKNLNELGKIGSDIGTSKKKLADTDAKIKALDKEISILQLQIDKEEKSLSSMRTEYLKAVKKMRSKRKQQSKLAFVFSAGSFNEAMRRMRYLKQFSEWREKQSAEISKKVAGLKSKSEKLAQAKTMHDREFAIQVKEQKELEAQYARQDAVVVELKKNGDALHRHLERKQQEANELNNRIASLIAEEQRRAEAERKAEEHRRAEAERLAEERLAEESRSQLEAQNREEKRKTTIKKEAPARETPKKETPKKETPKKESQKAETVQKEVSYAEARKRRPRQPAKPGTGSEARPSAEKQKSAAPAASSGGNFESMKGLLPRPVSGAFKVTSRFGRQSLPDMPNVSYDNPGIDAEVSPGASAQAVYAGKVSGVYMLPGYNTVVIVNHGNYYTVYGNIASARVKVGDTVKQGQALGGLAAQDDDSAHSSIHFEVWRNRDKLDPMLWIR